MGSQVEHAASADSGRQRRRETTTEGMLDAAEELFSTQGFTAVSVREIAEHAGVSHALVHRYLGPKEEIYRAVLRRSENAIRAAAGDVEDVREAIPLMLREGLKHRAYLRLIAHSVLHGLPFDSTMGRFPATERLVELAERRAAEGDPGAGRLDPRFAIAAVVSLYLGWVAVGDWVVRAAGMEGLDEETEAAGLERILLGIIERELPDPSAERS